MITIEGKELEMAMLYFNKAAEIARKNSRCLKSKRGVVIVDDGEIIGEGYNSPPREKDICVHCMRDYFKNCTSTTEPCRAIHAEERAILDAFKKQKNLEGSVMYHVKVKNDVIVPSTIPSCTICSKLVEELDISFVMLTKEGVFQYLSEEFNQLSFEYAWKQLNNVK